MNFMYYMKFSTAFGFVR